MNNEENPTTDQPAIPARPDTPEIALTAPMPAVSESSIPSVAESAAPEVPQPTSTPTALADRPKKSHKKLMRMAVVLLLVALVGGAVFAAYSTGNSRGYAKGKLSGLNDNSVSSLKVPTDATIVAQCTPGAGTQYIAPKDIPVGPIYNVWQNKVIGIEYMVSTTDIAKGDGLDLPTLGKQFKHVDITSEPAGHAGLSESHYHVVLSNMEFDDEKKMTCNGTSAGAHETGTTDTMQGMDMTTP